MIIILALSHSMSLGKSAARIRARSGSDNTFELLFCGLESELGVWPLSSGFLGVYGMLMILYLIIEWCNSWHIYGQISLPFIFNDEMPLAFISMWQKYATWCPTIHYSQKYIFSISRTFWDPPVKIWPMHWNRPYSVICSRWVLQHAAQLRLLLSGSVSMNRKLLRRCVVIEKTTYHLGELGRTQCASYTDF